VLSNFGSAMPASWFRKKPSVREAAAREGGTPSGSQPDQTNRLLRHKIRKGRLERKPETAVPGFPGWIVRPPFPFSWAGVSPRKADTHGLTPVGIYSAL